MPTSLSTSIETPPAATASGETYECEPADPTALNRPAPEVKRPLLAGRALKADRTTSQVSLGELMVLMTFLCTMFAGFCWLSRGSFAGATGMATVLSLRFVESDQSPLVVRLAWWMLLFTYLTAAAMAFWNL